MRPSNPPTPRSSNRYTTPLSGPRRPVAICALRIWFPVLLMAGGAIAPSASGGSITYEMVDHPTLQNGYTVSGFITTDGTTGIITNADTTNWNISVTNSGLPIFDLNPSNSRFAGSFQATLTDITSPGYNALIFNPDFPAVTGINWYAANDLYNAELNLVSLWSSTWSAADLVATSAVPEPSASALLAMGALGAGAFIAQGWFRQRRDQRRLAAAA